MNQLTTYEQLIAEKLQQLPVPDMADAIWARIEQRLDVEMPENPSDPSSGGNHSLPGFQFPGNIILFCFLAALISVVFYLNRPGRQQQSVTEATASPTVVSPAILVGDKKNSVSDKPAETIYRDRADLPVDIATDKTFSTQEPSVENAVQPVEIKSQPIIIREEATPAPQSLGQKTTQLPSDSIPKKRRGVQGITNADYRIAPVKKDSL